MDTRIIHIDMDAFYAAVEVRDNPALAGLPLIIGNLPSERGIVATCSYEARKFGVRSAMNIKEAYRLCPDGIYMHPNFDKYVKASKQIHDIWSKYTDVCQYIALDEAFLDVTHSHHLFGGYLAVAQDIKERTKAETDLTCSVGIGYSLMSAKLAGEEKKPDGLFQILTPNELTQLIKDRSVRTIFGVGAKTERQLSTIGITLVRHVMENPQKVKELLGNHGSQVVNLARGIDNRQVVSHAPRKSIGSEHTFQKDITDFSYLQDMLLLTAHKLSFDLRSSEQYCRTITLKVTYANMRSITRSKSGEATNNGNEIYKEAAAMLSKIERQPIRLVGISCSGLTDTQSMQLTLDLIDTSEKSQAKENLDRTLLKLQQKYGKGIIKTGSELGAEKRIYEDI